MSYAVNCYYDEMSESDREDFSAWLDDNNELLDEDCGIFDIPFALKPLSIYQNKDLTLTEDGEEFLKYYVSKMQEFLEDPSDNAALLHSHYEDYRDYLKEKRREEEEEDDSEDDSEEEYLENEEENLAEEDGYEY